MSSASQASATPTRRVVHGRRRCVLCRYSLTGQPVVRDEHYRLWYVRCPECGAVASTQEHPLLGRWARVTVLPLAASWVVAIGGAWLGTALLVFLLSFGSTQAAVVGYGHALQRAYEQAAGGPAYQVIMAGGAPLPALATVPVAAPASGRLGFVDWWLAQDRDALLASAGGWSGAITWHFLWVWIPLAGLGFLLGTFWAVALPDRRRRGRGLLLALTLGGAVLFATPLLTTTDQTVWVGHMAASRQIGRPVLFASLAMAGVAVGLGLLAGRPLGRAAIRLSLPDRYRGSFARLWLADGKSFPAPVIRSQAPVTRPQARVTRSQAPGG